MEDVAALLTEVLEVTQALTEILPCSLDALELERAFRITIDSMREPFRVLTR